MDKINKQVYLQDGNTFSPADKNSLNVHETLPPGTYNVINTPLGFRFKVMNDFSLPPKLYGKTEYYANRIIQTFLSRGGGTGVLLSGDKGSGKTMLASRISQKSLREHGILTIVINTALSGDGFNRLIQGIVQPAVIIFDEFEKVYGRDAQNELLTLMDGTSSSHKLFILTCNSIHEINNYMLNRPGRLFYALEFVGLDKDFIEEYCNDNLNDKTQVRGVYAVSQFFNSFSFDMLKGLVEEMNRYGEKASDAMKMLNMKPTSDKTGTFDVTILRNGQPIICDRLSNTVLECNPLAADGWEIHAYTCYAGGLKDGETHSEGEIKDIEEFTLRVNQLISLVPDTNTYLFATDRADTVLQFKRRARQHLHFNYDAF